MNLKTLKNNLNHINTNNIIFFDTIDSTNLYCKENYKILNDKTIVLAKEQTSGKGKNNRKWFSPTGGIYLSYLLKNLPKEPQIIPLITSLAIIRALKPHKLSAKIKWPNDIIYNAKKLGGILVESKINSLSYEYIVIGIGLNLNSDVPSKEVENKFISLKDINLDREILVADIINQLDLLLSDNVSLEYILTEYRKNCILIGRNVILYNENTQKRVDVIDVNNDGTLLVKDLTNNIFKITSGEFSITGIDGYI
ncbi:MAG: biotin--[acetyl-CoA-carboxylase] ligase [Sarcina sp.]